MMVMYNPEKTREFICSFLRQVKSKYPRLKSVTVDNYIIDFENAKIMFIGDAQKLMGKNGTPWEEVQEAVREITPDELGGGLPEIMKHIGHEIQWALFQDLRKEVCGDEESPNKPNLYLVRPDQSSPEPKG